MNVEELEKARRTAERVFDHLTSDPGGPWCHPSHHVCTALDQAGAEHQLEHFGVEGVLDDQVDIQYLNTGETYETTLLYDGLAGEFLIGNWGDLLEEQERLTTCEQ